MNDKNKLPGWLRALIAVGSVLVFLLIVVLGAELWAKRKIRTSIEKEAFAIAGTPVDVRIGRVGVSLASMSLSVRGVTLRSQNNDPSNSDAALVSLAAGIDKVSLRGIGYRKVDGKPALSARMLLIDKPHGTVVTKAAGKGQDDSDVRKEKKDFQQVVTEYLNSVSVERVEVRDAGVEYITWVSADENTRVKLTDGKLVADGFRIDSLPSADKLLFCEDIALDVRSLSYGYAAGAMVAEVDTLSARSSGALSLAAFRLIPQYAKNEYAQKSKGHEDWTKADVTGIDCSGVDFRRLVAEKALAIDSVSLAAADVASYKNRQVYQQPTVKPMVWQTVQQLTIPVDIRKITFGDVAVEYDELSETGDTPGVVRFSQGRGEVLNFTNIAEGHDPYFEVHVSATLMNSGEMNASCYFPVSPSNDHFRVTGRVGRTDMTSFNPVLTPLMNIRMNSGVMNSLVFDLDGSHIESHIELTMLYNDLSVSLLKPHNHARERGFLTFVADDILIKSDNPKDNGKVRTGLGSYKHDPYRSMYNYMWKSFIPGIVQTVL